MPDSIHNITPVASQSPGFNPEPANTPAKESATASHKDKEATARPKPKTVKASSIDTTSVTEAMIPDSMAAETKVYRNALEQRTCHEVDAPKILHLRNATLGRVAYSEGIEPTPRPLLPGYDSGVMMLILALFLIISANFRHYSTFIKTFAQDLFTVRRRANAFDDNNTMSETRVLLSLVALVCVCEGILLYSSLSFSGSATSPFGGIGMLTVVSGLYYIWQLAAYRAVGFLFASPTDTSQWLKGFNASQSLLGLGLIVPALLTLFNPGLTPLLLSVSVFLYGVARVIFISKGFRIFYDNYTSLIYFILYLCTLEIIPPVILYQIASDISIKY